MAPRSSASIVNLLHAEEDTATTIIWTLDSAQFLDRSVQYRSEHFTAYDDNFHLRISVLQHPREEMVLELSRQFWIEPLLWRCTIETTAGEILKRDFTEDDSLFFSFDDMRRLLGGSQIVRLVVTLFPEHRYSLELRKLRKRKPRLSRLECRGELRQMTKPGVKVVWTLGFSGDMREQLSEPFDLGDDSFRLRLRATVAMVRAKIVIGLERVGRGKEESVFLLRLALQKSSGERVLQADKECCLVQRFRGDGGVDYLKMDHPELFNLIGGPDDRTGRLRMEVSTREDDYWMDHPELYELLGGDRNGSLKIVCSLFRDDDCTRSVRDRDGLSRDFRELFLTGEESDITIQVEDTKFQGHKMILGTRCPFFATRFKQDTIGKNTGVLKIPHYSAEHFKDFLLYLYSGEVDAFTTEKALSLYRAADEYSVPDLKAECLEFLKSSLAVDTLGDVIALSLMYDEKELLKLAKQFLTENYKGVIKTASWKILLKKNLKEVKEMRKTALEAMPPKSKRQKV